MITAPTDSKEARPLQCLALDPPGAKVREGGFMAERMADGSHRLIIVGVLPPVELTNWDNVDMSIFNLSKRKNPGSTEIFSKEDRRNFGLQEGKPNKVIACEYILSPNMDHWEENIFATEAFGRWVDHGQHSEEPMCLYAKYLAEIIYKKCKHPFLDQKRNRWRGEDKPNEALYISNLMSELFNDTCRVYCGRFNVPFFCFDVKEGILRISYPFIGNFHRPLRDILALLNLENLHRSKRLESVLLSSNEIRHALFGVHHVLEYN